MKNVFLLISVPVNLPGCALDKQIDQSRIEANAYSPYNRKDWPRWIDAGKDCQNTRQELLIATNEIPVQFKNWTCRKIQKTEKNIEPATTHQEIAELTGILFSGDLFLPSFA